MKTWIKVAIGIISGFGAGFVSGFIFHKRLNDVEGLDVEQ